MEKQSYELILWLKYPSINMGSDINETGKEIIFETKTNNFLAPNVVARSFAFQI